MKTTKAIQFSSPKLQASADGQFPKVIELFHTGSWRTPWHGDFDVTEADLDEAIGHFNAGVYRVQGTEPLTGTLDHLGGESPAAYRILGLFRDGDRLMANVEWTALGKEKLERDEYRYVSIEFYPASMPFENPEVEGEILKNVVTGGTLTNDPLLKKLKPVMASARAGDGDKHKGETMTLEEIRAKQVAELTDEEKAFLAEHKSELTAEELKTYGLEEEEDEAAKAAAAKEAADKEAADKAAADALAAEEAKKLEASAKKLGIEAKELAQLRADAKAGREAKEQLATNEARQFVQASIAAGRVKSDQQDNAVSLLLASSGKQRTALETFINSLPENPILKAEAGSGKPEPETEVVITDEEKDLGSDFGNSADEIAAFKKSQSESK